MSDPNLNGQYDNGQYPNGQYSNGQFGNSQFAANPNGSYPQYQQAVPYGLGPSRTLVGIMGILFGGWGIHRFLMGYVGIGILQIVVTLITFGIGALWGFVEGIMVLVNAQTFATDAYGRPLS